MPQINRLNLPSAPAKQQLANKHAWNEQRRPGADFYTIGYSGRKTEEILAILKSAGIRTLVDIRQIPVSMYRPELSKGNLSRLVEAEGMFYLHLPDLGVPRDIRAKAIDAGSREVIWSWYDEHVIPTHFGLHYFFNAFEHPIALLCVEVDPHECHRHRLSLALESLGLTSFDL